MSVLVLTVIDQLLIKFDNTRLQYQVNKGYERIWMDFRNQKVSILTSTFL